MLSTPPESPTKPIRPTAHWTDRPITTNTTMANTIRNPARRVCGRAPEGPAKIASSSSPSEVETGEDNVVVMSLTGYALAFQRRPGRTRSAGTAYSISISTLRLACKP